MDIKEITKLLDREDIKSKKGKILFSFSGIQFSVESKDIVGGVLQEWFGNFLDKNGIKYTVPSNSQEWPDFILCNGDHLEIKAFNSDASPGFDIANFDAYTRSLLTHPERLDTDHLIFAYTSKKDGISVPNYWIRKVWEMTGPSDTNFLNLQVKQGVPVNIRPKDWRGSGALFKSRKEFVVALSKALKHFHPERYKDSDWLLQVSLAYSKKTGGSL